MCYQAVPDQTAWSPACAWGHAVSDDLVVWQERDLVLVPGPDELGCWSGCVVGDADGAPRAFYTRIAADDLELGKIAVARCDGTGRLTSSIDDVVIADPPAAPAVRTFRDPYVWRERRAWTMIVGAGTSDGAGAVLQYRSTDLDHWRYAGVLHQGRVPVGQPAAGQVWECPQMIQIGEDWVLVVSVQVGVGAGYVAACVGSYDGTRFAGANWQRLAFGAAPYATSLFRDRHGRPCMISWLREAQASHDPTGWAGAHSLVSTLAIDAKRRVVASPHPAVTASGVFTHRSNPSSSPRRDVLEVVRPTPTHLTVAHEDPIEIRTAGRRLALISRSAARDALVIERPGSASDVMPCGVAGEIELFLDADILEIFGGGHYGAWRLPPIRPAPARSGCR